MSPRVETVCVFVNDRANGARIEALAMKTMSLRFALKLATEQG